MAYSKNILPKSGAYYSMHNAVIRDTDLIIEAGGYAEINVSQQMLTALTSKMLVVIHPSVFSSGYSSDAVQVNVSVVTSEGENHEFLISACESSSGVFNTEIDLPAGAYTSFVYRVSSSVPVTIYNWELCFEQSDEAKTIIEGVEQSLPKLLYDYNNYSYVVEQREITVGLISCYLLDATDLQGHFTLNFFATERCNVHIRIKDNDVTELYAPHVFTVEKGYSSISIPHAYLHKLATDHSFAVTAQCTNGQLSIPTRGMLYTIDGGYLATRLLDAGIDVEDISIKQLPSNSSPSEIWALGFESTQLILKKSAYNRTQRTGWEAIKDFGEALCAALEFPGTWTLRGNTNKYTLETEENPFVFIVDLSGSLKVLSGENFEKAIELDTSVTALAACQGFSLANSTEHDQGMIVAYVKNGNVYCRQYTIGTAGEYVWQTIQTVYESGDASFVSVHRLPDYRVGICIEHSSGTKWLISERLYVGQAIKPELIRTNFDNLSIATVYPVNEAPEDTYLQTAVQNEFSDTDNYHNDFVMTFDGPLVFLKDRNIKDLKSSLMVSIEGVLQDASDVLDVTVNNNVLTVSLVEAVRGGNSVKIDFKCPYLAVIYRNNCFAAINQSYTWKLPIAPARAHEDIGANIMPSAEIIVRPIITSQRGSTDTCNVSLNPALDANVRAIITNTFGASDTCDVNIACSVNVSVSQAGTVPI